MSYCTLEEAWGPDYNKKKQKKKKRGLLIDLLTIIVN